MTYKVVYGLTNCTVIPGVLVTCADWFDDLEVGKFDFGYMV